MKSKFNDPYSGRLSLPSLSSEQAVHEPLRHNIPVSKISLSDLNALIPKLCDLMFNADHKIGVSSYEEGLGVENAYEFNGVSYSEAGWNISIEYKCCGEWYYHSADRWSPMDSGLHKVWGEIVSIDATWENDETGEYRDFTGEELYEVWNELEETLKDSLQELI